MTDFVRTMKDWRRMCDKYTTNDDDCCVGCPVVDYHKCGCGAIFEMDDVDWERYEKAIDKWAEENPEPIYPSWATWLVDQGVLACDESHPNMRYWYAINKQKIEQPIPTDIARKLEIKPKEM